MEKFIKLVKWTLFSVIALMTILVIGIVVFVKVGIYHPKDVETMEIHQVPNAESASPPPSDFKILNYNVQYFAGKDYVFFYDLPGFSGPDIRPSAKSISETLQNIAQLIIDEDPDVVLLQEVDEGSARTDNENQTERLLKLLEGRYPYFSEAFYWKVAYVPHPKINGSVGMKLTTLSKAPIVKSTRYQLPRIGGDILSRQFNFCRAILECHIETEKGVVAVLNTHLDAFPEEPDTMRKQVAKVQQVLENLEDQDIPWVIGGDFNLLPPGFKVFSMDSYSESSELTPLFSSYSSFPSLEQATSANPEPWLTHFPNDPSVNAPDKIIDYYFYSDDFEMQDAEVMQGVTWTYSDHLPLKATFKLLR
jgi:endonuclease/exonuclease/phosphatase family metal-dependent hydrolase